MSTAWCSPVDLAATVFASVVADHPLGHRRDTHGTHFCMVDAIPVHLLAKKHIRHRAQDTPGNTRRTHRKGQ